MSARPESPSAGTDRLWSAPMLVWVDPWHGEWLVCCEGLSEQCPDEESALRVARGFADVLHERTGRRVVVRRSDVFGAVTDEVCHG